MMDEVKVGTPHARESCREVLEVVVRVDPMTVEFPAFVAAPYTGDPLDQVACTEHGRAEAKRRKAFMDGLEQRAVEVLIARLRKAYGC